MKNIIRLILPFMVFIAFLACEKKIDKTTMTSGTAPTVTLAPSTLTLTSTGAKDTVVTISWTAANFGYDAATSYTVEIAKSGTSFAGKQVVTTGTTRQLKYIGSVMNDLAIGLGISPGTTGKLDIRIKSSLSDSLSIYSSVSTLTVTTYQVEFPALLVQGGNSWVTPSTRTAGYLLTSPNFNNLYEGYLNLPNADGFGGDAFKLMATSSGVVYGWGGSSTTITAGSTGNLWLTPAPNYMKVNVDVTALTINYTPVKFYVTGDHNGWNTSANPMTYDAASKRLIATNVSFTAGNKFVFTANGAYDISYKIDGTGKLVFAGPPAWAGNNIPAPGTGVYTVILDLSAGDGKYTYTIQ